MANTSPPQKRASRTSVIKVLEFRGEGPLKPMRVSASPMIVAQINTFVGLRITAKTASVILARRGQALRWMLFAGFGFSLTSVEGERSWRQGK